MPARLALVLAAAVLTVVFIAGAVAASTAQAEWRVINDEGWRGWYENGKYTGRKIPESAYRAMAERAVAGAAKSVGGSTPSISPTQVSKGDDVWTQLRGATSGAGKESTLRRVLGQGYGVLDRIGRFPALKAFGTISLLYSAASVGYGIGGQLADLFIPAADEPEVEGSAINYATHLNPMSPGDKREGYVSPGGEWIVGFSGDLISENSTWVILSTGGCPESGDWSWVGQPAGATPQPSELKSQWCPSEGQSLPHQFGVETVPLEVEALPPDGVGADGKREKSAPTPLSDGAAINAVEDDVFGDPKDDELAGWWWNHDPDVQEATVVEGGELDVDPADPLQVRVPTPLPGETYTAYGERLEGLGLVPEPVVLPDYGVDPSRGPLEVVTTNPKPGKNVEEGSTVRVRYNPATAPEASAPPVGGACSAPVDGIDIAPLGVSLNDKFPFGVLGWVVATMGAWVSAAEPPVWELTLGNGIEWTIDFAAIEPFLDVIRIAILIVACLGFVFFLAAAATKTESGISSE